MIIKNHDQVVERLTQIIVNFQKRLNGFQTDVYGYLNKDGTIRLETFINVGGNSWKNDGHILVYSDYEHADDMMSNLSNGSNGASWSWLIDEIETLYGKSGIAQEIIDAISTSDNTGVKPVCIEDLDVVDVEQYLVEHYLKEITSYYEDVFIQKNVIILGLAEDAIKEITEKHSFVVLAGNTLICDAEDYDTALRLSEEVPGSTISVWTNRAIMTMKTAAM